MINTQIVPAHLRDIRWLTLEVVTCANQKCSNYRESIYPNRDKVTTTSVTIGSDDEAQLDAHKYWHQLPSTSILFTLLLSAITWPRQRNKKYSIRVLVNTASVTIGSDDEAQIDAHNNWQLL